MKTQSILAYDIGTSSVKATLFDLQGRSLASASEAYSTQHPQNGWAEQDPESWWNGIVSATSALLAQPGAVNTEVAAIGCSGHMTGCLPVDKNGHALYGCLIHSDSRALSQYERIRREIGENRIYAMSGNILDPRASLCKMLWFSETEPEIYAHTAKFLQSKDFIAARLTGNIDTTDYSDASHGALMDVRARAYDRDIYAQLGLEVDKLPEIHRSVDVVGNLCAESARLLGLPSGIPVAAGAGDGICANIGSGVSKAGDTYISLGTTAWVAGCAKEPLLDAKKRVFSIQSADGESFGVFGTMQSACGSLDWARNILGEDDLTAWNEQASRVVPGSDGLVFLPYLDGERSPIFDPKAMGVFFGMSASHTRAHFMRAVLEGVAYALRSIYDVFAENGSIDKMRIIGGGAKSELWRQIIADVLGCALEQPHMRSSDVTSLGAAAIAGNAAGILSMERLGGFGLIGVCRTEPDIASRVAYDRGYAVYSRLYPSLKELF